MIATRMVGPDDWEVVRGLRLAALRDSPDSFWSTYEEEVDRDEAWWRDRLDHGRWFVAYLDGEPVGLVAVTPSYKPGEDTPQLISMWVSPAARGRGVGDELIETARSEARAQGHDRLQLEVAAGNAAARRLYERCGFRATGRTQPLPRKPSVVEHEMEVRF